MPRCAPVACEEASSPNARTAEELGVHAPGSEIILTEAVGREFRVDRVTVVHRDKQPRGRRRRLGLSARVFQVKKAIRRWNFFESGDLRSDAAHRGA